MASNTRDSIGRREEEDLAPFMGEVREVRKEMEEMNKALAALKEANQEMNSVGEVQAVKAAGERMEKEAEQAVRSAEVIKAKVAQLDRGGCTINTDAARTRIATTNGLRNSLKNTMREFQAVRQKIGVQCRESIERRYESVSGQSGEQMSVEQMMEVFLQRAVEGQGRSPTLLHLIQLTHCIHLALINTDKLLLQLHRLFLHMSLLVHAQAEPHHPPSSPPPPPVVLTLASDDPPNSPHRRWAFSLAILSLLILLLLFLLALIFIVNHE
eukprot:Gb_03337 [translate_table: standard]